jgi:hypothetical protein
MKTQKILSPSGTQCSPSHALGEIATDTAKGFSLGATMIDESALVGLHDAILEVYGDTETGEESTAVDGLWEAYYALVAPRYQEWLDRQSDADECTVADWVDALTGGNSRGR